MTLILVLASELEVHMTCDFKLTDVRTGKEMSIDTHKLVSVRRPALQAVVGATGLALLGRQGVADWVAATAGALPYDASLDDLIAALSGVSRELEGVPPAIRRFRHLSFVVGAIQGSQSVIGLISNFQNFKGYFLPRGQNPATEMELDIVRPSKPVLRVAGEVNAIRKDERKAAESMLRSSLEGSVIRERLAGLNKRAADRVKTVSEGCYTASEYATGRGEAEPYLVEQTGEFIPPEFQHMMDQLGLKINSKILPDGSQAPIQIRGAAAFSYAPSPAYFREQFKLRPNDPELWNNFGSYEASEGRPASARSAFEKALQLKPDSYFAARNLGNLLWRTFNNSESGKRYFGIALNEPDANHRRDTLSLLAETTSIYGEDVDLAERYYLEAMEGDLLPIVAVRYALFLLDYRPARVELADSILQSVLERDPNFGRAIIGKVHCELRLNSSPDHAVARIVASADEFERDADLTINAAYASLYTGDCVNARRFFARLERIKNVSQEAMLSLTGMVVLCEGGSLDDVVTALDSAGGPDNLINLATIAWARGRGEEHTSTLSEIPSENLPVAVRIEHLLVRRLGSGATDADIISAALQQFGTASLRAFDPTVMALVAKHPEIPYGTRERLLNLITAVQDVSGSSRG